MPVVTGGQSHDSHHASSAPDCINPKGFNRLSCAKKDAVVGITFAILGLIVILFLICLYMRRKGARKSRHEEDAMEMSRGVMDCNPGLQTEDAVSDGKSNIGRAVSTSDENLTLAKERTQDSAGGNSSLVCQPQLSRLSSGMLRTAKLGLALQDPTMHDVPPSLASSRENSELKQWTSDIGAMLYASRNNGEWPGPGAEWIVSVDDGDEEVEEGKTWSSGRSSLRLSSDESDSDEEVEEGKTWSSGRSSLRLSSDSSDGDTLDVTASKCSPARQNSPPVCHQGEMFFSPGSEPIED